jgi:hypothetical protein
MYAMQLKASQSAITREREPRHRTAGIKTLT